MIAMAAAPRRVQRLHLRAPDDTLARRGVRLLEDAVRTASLPDAGARLLVFRRFALGRFRAGIAPQTLALALERRVAALRDVAVHAAAPDAAQAGVVWFRDALEAHTLLALRVVAGAPATEWFWRLVVPGIERAAATPQRLRLVLQALASRPEAPAALPALVRALARQGHANLLRAVLGAAQAAALLAPYAAGASADAAPVIIPPDAPATAVQDPSAPVHSAEDAVEIAAAVAPRDGAARAADSASNSALPDSAGSMRSATTQSADARATDARAPVTEQQHEQIARLRPRPIPADVADALPLRIEPRVDDAARPARQQTADAAGAPREGHDVPDLPADAAPRALVSATAPSSPAAQPARDTPAPRSAARDLDAGEAVRTQPLEQPPWPSGAPTEAGGLLFLLPVLARLGFPQWIDAAPEWVPRRIDRNILALVCTRLELPTDDPAWRLCASPERPSPQRFCAPSRWTGGIADCDGAWRRTITGDRTMVWDASGRLLLAAWRGRRRPAAFAPLLQDRHVVRSRESAREIDLIEAVAAAWLTACRRWLRRHARISVAGLVSRPARLSLTPTHADVFFALSDVSLAVRRSGLDVNPGWVPWFGRVVSFHYGDAPWT
jgi:hypothetical protein